MIGFLWNNAIISMVFLVIMLLKAALKNHTTAGFQYYIWVPFLFMSFLPFLPFTQGPFCGFPGFRSITAKAEEEADFAHAATGAAPGDWLQDFAITVQHHTVPDLHLLFTALWACGVVFMSGMFLVANHRLHQMKQDSVPCLDNEIAAIFSGCKTELKISRCISLYQSDQASTPMSFGIVHPCIILPATIRQNMSESEIRYILLHELQHYKSKDIYFNYAICLSAIIYWFNPFVWFAIKQVRIDREVACDASVLRILGETSYMAYGNTIIHFAEQYLRRAAFSLILEFTGGGSQIHRRISEIAQFKMENSKKGFRSSLAILLVFTTILSITPMTPLNVFAFGDYDDASENLNTEYEDLSSYFPNMDGSFVLYNLAADSYEIHNLKQSSKRVSPDSTVKIYSALFALEYGIISPENTKLPWDHSDYPYEEWNGDQNLDSAMRYSVTWYFQELNRRMGMEKLQDRFDQIGYGNRDLSGGINDFWAESSLKISPIEQVEQMTRFYQNDFKLDPKNVGIVKDAMLLSRSNNCMLFGKTGTGDVEGRNKNGWFVGFVETEGNTYFFATNIQNGENCSGSTAAKITLSILADKKIYRNDSLQK
jgi:bla regulator protein BlaR1